MSDTEKQEGQKTVVAFIAGLLIGGLLVWVFSSSPEDQSPEEILLDTGSEEMTDTESEGIIDEDTTEPSNTPNTPPVTTTSPEVQRTVPANIGDGEIEVLDQGAGSMVVLSSVEYPAPTGWIAVRDYADGEPGNVLGAARFNEVEGLLPTAVRLLRPTEAGNTYQVVFYTEDGDKEFKLESDELVPGVETMFEAK